MPPDGKPQKQKGRLRHAPGGHHVEQDLQKQQQDIIVITCGLLLILLAKVLA